MNRTFWLMSKCTKMSAGKKNNIGVVVKPWFGHWECATGLQVPPVLPAFVLSESTMVIATQTVAEGIHDKGQRGQSSLWQVHLR